MSTFRYRAATAAGEMVEGVLRAPSREGALGELRGRALRPVSLTEAPDEPSSAGARTGSAARVQLTRTLATLLGSGFTVDRALGVAADLTDDARLKGIVQAVRQDIRAGRSLADALAAHPRTFPPVYSAMVAAGEQGGAIGATFARLAELQEEAAAMRSQLLSTLLYPALMLAAGGIAVGLLVFLVVPQFAGVLEDAGGTLPLTTRVLLAATSFGLAWGWLLALLLAAAAVFALRALRAPGGRARLDAWLLRVPVLGDLLLRLATARVARTLGTLTANGVPLVSALGIAQGTAGNEALRLRMDEAARAVREGQPLSAATAPLLPRLAARMIAVGEESGTLPEMLLRVADVYDDEVQRALRRAVTLVEPMLILLFGGVVGFVALAMLQAIYGINAGAL